MNPKTIKALRKIFPEYIDDVAETAIKNTDELVDKDVLKVISSEMAQQADQAVVPMGSGSRLDALIRASKDAPDARKMDDIVDSVDDMSKAFQQGDDVLDAARRTDNARLVGEAVDKGPSNFTMPNEYASVPATRSNTLPVKTPEVMDRNLPTVLNKQPEDFINATAKEITPKGINYGKAAAIGGGLGLAGMGLNSMMGGDQEQIQIPLRPKQQKEEKLPEAKTNEDKQSVQQVLSNITNPQQSKEEKVDSMSNYIKMLDDAQKRDDKNEFLNTMLRAAIQAGAALGMTKADYSGVDALSKQAKQVDKVKARMGTDKAYREMQEEAKLADPNSDISKQSRALLIKMGYPADDKMSAKQLKDMGVNIYNLLGQEKAQEVKMKIAETTQGVKNEEQKKKFAQSLRKEVTTGALGKQYSNFAQSERMAKSLDEFRKNPSGYKDYATLMGGLKALQGDESVVREAEVRMGKNAASMIVKASNYLDEAISGKSLQDSQRRQMVETIAILRDIGRDQYLQAVSPILEQAKMEGIDTNLILPRSLSSDKKEPSTSPSIKLPSQMKPNSVITTKSGKRYKVNQDGMTATEI